MVAVYTVEMKTKYALRNIQNIYVGVCIIDDDRFYTNIGDLEFGFSVWQV